MRALQLDPLDLDDSWLPIFERVEPLLGLNVVPCQAGIDHRRLAKSMIVAVFSQC